MNMKSLDSLKDMYCRELEQIEEAIRQKGINPELVKQTQILTDTIKNIDKIIMLEEGCSDDGYSRDGRWEARINGMYDRDGSYANRRGTHYVKGHYSHDGRYGRDGGYSHGDTKSEMLEHLEDVMEMAGSDKEREVIRRCMNEMRNS